MNRTTMNRLLILSFGMIAMLSSCGTDEYMNAAKLAAEAVGAKTYEVSSEHSTSSDPKKTIKLTLHNPELISKEYSSETIISTSALIFYKNLAATDLKDNPAIAIELLRDGKTENKIYYNDELKIADDATSRVADFLSWNPAEGVGGISSLVDNEYIPDSALTIFGERMMNVEKQSGKIIKTMILGFKKETVTDQNIPVLAILASAQRENLREMFTFYVSTKNGRIISVSV